MSHKKDTDYLSISSRIRAMETRLLTRDRLERMIDARDNGEALKVLAECGYGELTAADSSGLERALSAAREDLFRELASALPDGLLPDIFRLKYDYHNAKVLLKARATGQQADRLLVSGGRYDPQQPEQWGDLFRQAVERAETCMNDTGDPQLMDLLLDKACFEEMGLLAKRSGSDFLQGYVRLAIDAANLRSRVRCARLEKSPDFLKQVLMEGGTVSVDALLRSREPGELFRVGPLCAAAQRADELSKPGAGALTAFERECDNALMAYQEKARRTPFGEEVVAGYLFAREAELTAIRTVMAGRMAGLDGDVIRKRLRDCYL